MAPRPPVIVRLPYPLLPMVYAPDIGEANTWVELYNSSSSAIPENVAAGALVENMPAAANSTKVFGESPAMPNTELPRDAFVALVAFTPWPNADPMAESVLSTSMILNTSGPTT